MVFDPTQQGDPWSRPLDTAKPAADNADQARRKTFQERAAGQANPNLPNRSALLAKTAAQEPPPLPVAPLVEYAEAAPTPLMQSKTLAMLAPAAGGNPEDLVPLIPLPEEEETPAMNAAPAQGAEATPDVGAPPAVQETATMPASPIVLDNILPLPPEVQAQISQPPGEALITPAPEEPAPGLSSESKGILQTLPAHLGPQAKDRPKNLDISRAKDTKYVSQAETPKPFDDKAAAEKPEAEDAATSEKHEAMGIKLSVKRSPMNINYELEKAYNALISGHTQAAIEIYKNILTNDPKNTLAMFGLATTYHRAGQIDMARPLYGQVLALEPNNRDALNNFLVLLADEAPQEALTQLQILEEKNPDFSPIPAQMAVIYQKLGETDKASDKMFKAVALAPENLTYRYNLAIILDKQGKYGEAVKLYMQLVEAYRRGEPAPGNIQKIQERLTFLRSNKS